VTRLTAEDIKGIYAILPTPAKPNASDPNATDTVDFAETSRAVEALIADGVDGLLMNGTYGEGATLTWDEHRAFTEVVIETVRRRVPVFVGATTLNTRDTISRAKTLHAMGPNGLFLGRPMWCESDDDTIVDFYRSVAEALPDMAIVVYDNPEAFKGKISPKAYARLAQIPQIVAAKYIAIGPWYLADLATIKGKIRLLPIDQDWYHAWRWAPDAARACWSSSATCGPEPIIALKQAIESGNAERGQAITEEMRHCMQTFFPKNDFHLFSRYNIPLVKIRIDTAGYMRAGPCRHPYHHVPEEYAEGAREAGRRWAKLREKYRER
jgi:4-(2-carboxyphenyl)-2-oxobut-3-enoate aldolase